MRLLVAARLSQSRKGQTGIDTQDIDARAWAERNGHEIVATAADKISGRVSPMRRPNLGPWLTEPTLRARYDGVLASKIDRLTRGRDWAMREWAEEHGKKLLVVSPELVWPPEPGDLSTPIVWDNLMNLASAEWDNTSQRYRRMQRSLRESGYLVGKPTWGFRIVPSGDTEHSTLAPDPDLVPYLRGMIERAFRGDTLASICDWLDGEGVPPAHGGHWSPKSVSQILRNESLAGRRRQGKSTLRHEGIIDLSTHKRLVAKLDSNPKRRGPVSRETALLTGVAYCDRCGRVMHRRRSGNRRKDGSQYVYETYRCDGTPREPSRCRNLVRQSVLDEFVHRWFTEGPINDADRVEVIHIPGNHHQDALDQNRQDIAELDIDADDYLDRLSELRAERQRIQNLPAQPDEEIAHFTGQTIRDFWLGMTPEARRVYMIENNIRVYVDRERMRVDLGTDPSNLWFPTDPDWTPDEDG